MRARGTQISRAALHPVVEAVVFLPGAVAESSERASRW